MECDFVALARNDMTIKTVVGHIEFPANKPFAVRQIPFTDRVPRCIP